MISARSSAKAARPEEPTREHDRSRGSSEARRRARNDAARGGRGVDGVAQHIREGGQRTRPTCRRAPSLGATRLRSRSRAAGRSLLVAPDERAPGLSAARHATHRSPRARRRSGVRRRADSNAARRRVERSRPRRCEGVRRRPRGRRPLQRWPLAPPERGQRSSRSGASSAAARSWPKFWRCQEMDSS